MRDSKASRTAQDVASLRGMGPCLPPEGRLIDDPWGAEWTGRARWRKLAELAPPLARVVSRPGWSWLLYMQVRSYALDEAVREFASRGGRQLVLLGAGLDARALRLRSLELRVFEVDHPATQAQKRTFIGNAATLVTWDFERDPLRELPARLASDGFDLTAPSCVLWEGVTMYLTERAIDDTFAMLRELLRPGSVVVFTYFTKARLQRTSLGSRLLSRHVASIGEPWRFGWEPASLPQWLETRGFQLLSDDESGLLARKWLPPHLARRVPADGRRIARVTPA